jgi:hypothetical protein
VRDVIFFGKHVFQKTGLREIQFLFYFHNAYWNNQYTLNNRIKMKPVHHLLMSALKNALIVIAAFALYETIEELKILWKTRFPKSVDMHVHYGRLLHLVSIFIADFTIGLLMYQLFNYLH